MDVIKRLNDLRLERKMSVYRLAELTGINQSTLANTFSRGIVPSILNLGKMCEAMGLTLAQFFSEGEKVLPLTEREQSFVGEYQKLPSEIKNSIEQMVVSIVAETEVQ